MFLKTSLLSTEHIIKIKNVYWKTGQTANNFFYSIVLAKVQKFKYLPHFSKHKIFVSLDFGQIILIFYPIL